MKSAQLLTTCRKIPNVIPFRHLITVPPPIKVSEGLNRPLSQLLSNHDLLGMHRNFYPFFVDEASAELAGTEFVGVSKRFQDLCYYTAPNRELYSGEFMMYGYKILAKPEDVTLDNLKSISLLGWILEALNTTTILIDDILDNQKIRWKGLSWHRKADIGLSAVKDANLLRLLPFILLRKHFGRHPSYPSLLKILTEYIFMITIAETLDTSVLTEFQKERDVSIFATKKYQDLSCFKSYFLTMRCPTLSIMHLTGQPDEYRKHDHIFKKIGHHLQIQNDIFGCFGKFEKVGKPNDDITEGKLGWVIVKALELASEEQRSVLQNNYGQPQQESKEIVMEIFREMDLIQRYYDYKTELKEEVYSNLEEVGNQKVSELIKTFVVKFIDVDDELSY